MKSGFICRPTSLRFVGSPLTIPAFYYEHGKRLEEADTNRGGILTVGNIKSVIAETHEEAEIILRKRVGEALRGCAWWNSPLKPSDFRFSISFSEIKDGEFWHMPASTYCKEYIPE